MFSTRWCLWTVTWCVPTTRLNTTDLFSAGQTRAAPSAPVSAGPHRLAQSDWLCHYHLYLWHLYNISQHFLAASYNKFPPEKQQPSLIITSLYSSHSTHSLHCSTSALAAHQHCSGLWGISCHSFIKILPPLLLLALAFLDQDEWHVDHDNLKPGASHFDPVFPVSQGLDLIVIPEQAAETEENKNLTMLPLLSLWFDQAATIS